MSETRLVRMSDELARSLWGRDDRGRPLEVVWGDLVTVALAEDQIASEPVYEPTIRVRELPPVRPLGSRILVRTDDPNAERVSAGGIVLPQLPRHTETGPTRGLVLAVGPGARDREGRIRPVSVSPGDRVVFLAYAGQEILVGEEKLRILGEHELVGVEAAGEIVGPGEVDPRD